ncbi:MAG: hypothetical protein HYZ53_23460 [Planctomycetes bacterium]|nr:hypothetical protein [Planctomycetota bacterium]
MKQFLLAAAFLASTALTVAAEETKNTWAAFKPGSWSVVKMKTVSEMQGQKTESSSETKTTLLEITATEVVLEVESETTSVVAGQAYKSPKTKSTMKQPLKYEGTAQPADPAAPKPETGEEEVSVGGKKVKCKWSKLSFEAAGNKTTSKSTYSDEVPGSMVKMESKTEGTVKSETTMELTAFEAK